MEGGQRSGGSLKRDELRYWKLLVARDTYGKHYGDLTPQERERVPDLIALEIERDRRESESGAKSLKQIFGG